MLIRMKITIILIWHVCVQIVGMVWGDLRDNFCRRRWESSVHKGILHYTTHTFKDIYSKFIFWDALYFVSTLMLINATKMLISCINDSHKHVTSVKILSRIYFQGNCHNNVLFYCRSIIITQVFECLLLLFCQLGWKLHIFYIRF